MLGPKYDLILDMMLIVKMMSEQAAVIKLVMTIELVLEIAIV